MVKQAAVWAVMPVSCGSYDMGGEDVADAELIEDIGTFFELSGMSAPAFAPAQRDADWRLTAAWFFGLFV